MFKRAPLPARILFWMIALYAFYAAINVGALFFNAYINSLTSLRPDAWAALRGLGISGVALVMAYRVVAGSKLGLWLLSGLVVGLWAVDSYWHWSIAVEDRAMLGISYVLIVYPYLVAAVPLAILWVRNRDYFAKAQLRRETPEAS